MSAGPETPGVVIGNHTAKYTARNPAVRWLTSRFVDRLDGLVGDIAADQRPATRPLEVGAGEGVISQRMHRRFGSCVALDLPTPACAEWRSRPGPAYLHADALRLPFRDEAFDLVVCVEVLEHLRDPRPGCASWRGSARATCCCRCPHEPFFRAVQPADRPLRARPRQHPRPPAALDRRGLPALRVDGRPTCGRSPRRTRGPSCGPPRSDAPAGDDGRAQ
jgi:hypothetical protein